MLTGQELTIYYHSFMLILQCTNRTGLSLRQNSGEGSLDGALLGLSLRMSVERVLLGREQGRWRPHQDPSGCKGGERWRCGEELTASWTFTLILLGNQG